MCLAWWELPGFLLLYSAAGYQECKGLGLWGLSAQRRRSQQGLCARTLTQSNCYWVLFFVFLHTWCCAHPQQITTDISLTLKHFSRTKKKALLDVCLNEYETVNCHPNLIPLFPVGVLGGPILLLLTSPAGGQSDRIPSSPLLFYQSCFLPRHTHHHKNPHKVPSQI